VWVCTHIQVVLTPESWHDQLDLLIANNEESNEQVDSDRTFEFITIHAWYCH